MRKLLSSVLTALGMQSAAHAEPPQMVEPKFRSVPDELVQFFEQAVEAGMHTPSLRSQHLLSAEAAAQWTQSLRGHPIVDAPDGVVLDDVETSNHHVYVGAGPLAGAVFFLCHDGDSRVVYASLPGFLSTAIRARDDNQLVEEQRPARSPVADDQAGLGAWMGQLLTLEDRDVLVLPLVPEAGIGVDGSTQHHADGGEELLLAATSKNTMNLEGQCECCDHFTLGAKGEWEICPVCFWEDDGFGRDALDQPSGANHGLTLREARANFARIGACCEAMRAKVLPVDARGRYRLVPRQP